MNSNYLAVYSLKNNTNATLCGIAKGASKIIVLNPQYCHSVGIDLLLKSVNSEELTVSDITGTAIPFYDAYTLIQSIGREVLKFTQKIESSSSVSDSHHLSVRLEWNLSNVDSIVALIGEDVLRTDFTALGVTRSETISKIIPIFQQLSIGQFTEAVLSLSSLPVDAFYTAERISTYQTIISGVDSFNFEL